MKRVGVAVFGYARPALLRNVLESLGLQGALPFTHVFIDGHAYRAELSGRTTETLQVARSFDVAELRSCNGHLGIEKLMLDALTVMCGLYDVILVIEDDCFPNRRAVELLTDTIEGLRDEPDMFSAYGHLFRVPSEGRRFPRFQGWGWGAPREQLLSLLPQLKACFDMPEAEYLSWAANALTPEVRARLDVTPGRDVATTLAAMYSWDSCTALLTAQRGLFHRPTPAPVIFNCGLTPGQGHFISDTPELRQPPFNLVAPDEVWDLW